MRCLVNGQIVSEEVIRQEKDRLARDPSWQAISDETQRAQRLQEAAQWSAADRVLIEQLALLDPRPVDPAIFEKELERAKSQAGCRPEFDDSTLRRSLEHHLRVQRFRTELVAEAAKPDEPEIASFFQLYRDRFRQPELFHAAHIVKHVQRPEAADDVLAVMRAALAELEQGADFADVARRYSDCGEKGGDLGEFPAGYMVPEFEQAIAALEPGQRTGIFPSPFGFHIGLLIGRTPAGPAGLDRVRSDIERVLTFAKQHEVYARKIVELRSQADIRWVPEQASAVA